MAPSNSAPGSSRPASPAAAAVAAAATEPAPSSSSSAGGAFTKSPEELRLKPTSSVRDQLKGTLAADRTEDWGTRVLKDDADVFSMNAWDHAPPPDDLEERAAEVKKLQRDHQVTDAMKAVYNAKPASFWDRFYDTHLEGFFKDRKWLRLEFPELIELTKPEAGRRTIVEIGCGAGNAMFPIVQHNENPELSVFGFDYSKSAVEVVKSNPLYKDPPTGHVHSAVWDLSSESIPESIEPGTVDIAVMVFVLSALQPGAEWERAMNNVWRMLKPGGLVLMRDYGRHDLAQMRIKKNRMLDEDFYIRGDGTRVYFFSPDDLAKIFTGAPTTSPVEVTTTAAPEEDAADGLTTPATPAEGEPTGTSSAPAALDASIAALSLEAEGTAVAAEEAALASASFTTPEYYFPSGQSEWHPPHPLFDLEQLGIDRRLLVNRKKQLKMYRCWMQVRARKLLDGQGSGTSGGSRPVMLEDRFKKD